MAEPILRLDGVSKQYPTKNGPLTVLEPTSMTMDVTELVSIVGPSGCGKSTLLHIVGGLIAARPPGRSFWTARKCPTPARSAAWSFRATRCFPG